MSTGQLRPEPEARGQTGQCPESERGTLPGHAGRGQPPSPWMPSYLHEVLPLAGGPQGCRKAAARLLVPVLRQEETKTVGDAGPTAGLLPVADWSPGPNLPLWSDHACQHPEYPAPTATSGPPSGTHDYGPSKEAA